MLFAAAPHRLDPAQFLSSKLQTVDLAFFIPNELSG